MALTTTLYTGLSGLDVNSRSLDVIGNNIANVNTSAFKSSRSLFATQLSQNLGFGTPPGGESGGTNPTQIGLGARFEGTQRNLQNGAIQQTGVGTDLALEGSGFFIVNSKGEDLYSRDGAFTLNAENQLVTQGGGFVQGYGVDDGFNIVPGALESLTIPLGTMTMAEATRNVNFAGNINASGGVASTGSQHMTRAFYRDAGLTTLADGTEDMTDPATSLYIDDGAGGSFLAFQGGTDTVMTISGVEKGGTDLGTHTFGFTDAATADTLGVDGFGSTMDDFASFLDDVFGLDDTLVNGQQLGGGVSFDPATGQLVIDGNEGTAQALNIETANFVAGGGGISQPMIMSKTGSADGESVRTSFVVFDSLGTPLTIDTTMVLQEVVPGGGTIWEFVAESDDNAAGQRVIGLGTVEFDNNGQFVTASNTSVSLTRNNGAISPLTISLNFESEADAVTALTDQRSEFAAVFQDGTEIGTLESFGIGETGEITGSFTNGLNRTLGQVAIAKFTNPEGLVDAGAGLFRTGPNSGVPVDVAPTSLGSARIISGALELSNVDLSQEFVNLINASTGFSASSRVISTSDELVQQLLALTR